MIGYHSQVTIARPRINDGMAKPNAKQTIMHMIAAGAYIKGSRVNVLGPPVKVRFGRVQDLASLNRSLRMFRGRPCGC